VVADDTRLGQVFVNLLVNAAQAIREGDVDRNEITVVTRTGADGSAVVEVIDTGHGIDGDVLPRIFDPFFTTKEVGDGCGLGLSICHGIVTSLEGRIEVESGQGRGTCFRVVLPPAPAGRSSRPAAPLAAAQMATARARVLVVDDEPFGRRAMCRILRQHDVVEAETGVAALALLTEKPFDVVVCDLMMPQMTGMDLHKALREASLDVAERIIFVTGGAFTEAAQRFLDEVTNPTLQKPFDPRSLRSLVDDIARRAAVR
jgi:CheY-like chemotaxis protein